MPERLTPRKLKALVGTEIGASDWFTVTQERIEAFADCTEDRQWIHVDPARAAKGPLGGTVAHGYLLLSLLPHLMKDIPLLTLKYRMAVNYGLDRVRFISPVRSGARIRNRAVLKSLEKRGFRKVLVRIECTLAAEGVDKPAMIADLVVLIVF